MSFMGKILSGNKPVWEECFAAPFVQRLTDGTLPPEEFRVYMIQDSIYLKNYTRVYGKAIYHSNTFRDIQFYYSVLHFVTSEENAVRLNYLKQFGMTDADIDGFAPLPETKNYIDFLFQIAEGGNECEILMAVLPCMLSYSYIFRKAAAITDSGKTKYWDFIQDYAEEEYAENCREWSLFAEQKYENLSSVKQRKLSGIFYQRCV